ncbi:unnamed protein product [Didymodactylos carnosus]|uniref:RRM domain-containing protein n=1 Tax=Didymodactylos carnosus TaxID=1234261 RepID=A0A813TB66_9BILA|nr:unnamed protein product [Didymodactylos carnosus]CAF3592309.1 unnamed protein product [Didymodactylos carnosus]
MSIIALNRPRFDRIYTEICIGNVNDSIDEQVLLNHFEQYGSIINYNFLGGYVFITFESTEDVDKVMNNRPHNINGCNLYVKRALPYDIDHPKERYDTTRDLMVVVDDDEYKNNSLLEEMKKYFLNYGHVYGCKFVNEKNVLYVLVEFADYDVVDRIILDKPHYLNKKQLNVKKCIVTNKKVMKFNVKDSTMLSNNDLHHTRNNDITPLLTFGDAIDDDDDENLTPITSLSEQDLEAEILRLKDVIKSLNDDFGLKRLKLEEECCEKLKILNDSSSETINVHNKLEQGHKKLQECYVMAKNENEELNELYIETEFENFNIRSEYERMLKEQRIKYKLLEQQYNELLKEIEDDDN